MKTLKRTFAFTLVLILLVGIIPIGIALGVSNHTVTFVNGTVTHDVQVVANIAGPDIPLAPLPLITSYDQSWAFMNLILTVVGITFAALVAYRILILKKCSDTDEYSYSSEIANKRRLSWLIIVSMVAAVGIVVFFITQNMRDPVAMVDYWTIAHAAFVVVGAVSFIFVLRSDRNEENSKNGEIVSINNHA